MRRSYTPVEIDTALLVLCLTGRNSVVAARRLKTEGLDIDPRTLRSWRTHVHARRYEEIEAQHAPEVERQMLGQARAIVHAANQVTLLAIEESEKQLREGDVKDPSTTARNLATAAGIQTDKMLIMSGRPNEIRGGEDIQGLMERMSRFLGSIPATAIEIEYEPSAPPELEP